MCDHIYSRRINYGVRDHFFFLFSLLGMNRDIVWILLLGEGRGTGSGWGGGVEQTSLEIFKKILTPSRQQTPSSCIN